MSGKLRHLIRIDSGSVGNWSELVHAWAEIGESSESEGIRTYTLRIRSNPTTRTVKGAKDLGPTHRIIWNDEGATRELHIMQVLDGDMRRKFLNLTCIEAQS